MPEESGFWNRRLSVYQTALHRYFRRHASRAEEAEDLAQEVYLRLLRTDEREHGHIENAQAYLFTVAGNLLKERAVLVARSGAAVPLDESGNDLATTDPTAEETLYARSRGRRLWAVVDGLPPRYRAVLLLHYRYGLTYREIGGRVGITPHTVKKYVSHALVLCRRALKETGHWP
jgi:RNA polymerase sigma factor (sigma-70 family)